MNDENLAMSVCHCDRISYRRDRWNAWLEEKSAYRQWKSFGVVFWSTIRTIRNDNEKSLRDSCIHSRRRDKHKFVTGAWKTSTSRGTTGSGVYTQLGKKNGGVENSQLSRTVKNNKKATRVLYWWLLGRFSCKQCYIAIMLSFIRHLFVQVDCACYVHFCCKGRRLHILNRFSETSIHDWLGVASYLKLSAHGLDIFGLLMVSFKKNLKSLKCSRKRCTKIGAIQVSCWVWNIIKDKDKAPGVDRSLRDASCIQLD